MLAYSFDDVLAKAQTFFGSDDTIAALVAKVKSYAGTFALTDQELRDAKSVLEDLYKKALPSGTVRINDKTFTVDDIRNLLNENANLQNTRFTLENKLVEFISNVQTAMQSVDSSGQETAEVLSIPGMMGLGIAPLALAGILAAGGFLAYSLSSFIDSVRGHVKKTQGIVPFLFGESIYLYLGLAALAYLIFFHKKGE